MTTQPTTTENAGRSRIEQEIRARILSHGANLGLPVAVELWNEEWEVIGALAALRGVTIDAVISGLLDDALEDRREELREELASAGTAAA